MRVRLWRCPLSAQHLDDRRVIPSAETGTLPDEVELTGGARERGGLAVLSGGVENQTRRGYAVEPDATAFADEAGARR